MGRQHKLWDYDDDVVRDRQQFAPRVMVSKRTRQRQCRHRGREVDEGKLLVLKSDVVVLARWLNISCIYVFVFLSFYLSIYLQWSLN